MRAIALLFAATALTTPLAAQSSKPTYFIGTQGKDTVSLEEYSRKGNTITGTWVAIHSGVFVHKYTLTLDKNGRPQTYHMDYSVPVGPHGPNDLTAETVTYGADSAMRILFRNTPDTSRYAMHDSYPVLGKSLIGYEIALAKLRAAHADTGTISIHPPTNPQMTATPLKVKMFGADSAILAGAAHIRYAKDGALTEFEVPGAPTKRVAPFDMERLTAAFVASEAPKIAAEKAAMAARVEITLPSEVFDKLAGDYTLNGQVTLTVKRDGNQFLMGVAGQPFLQIAAESPTKFFARQINVTVEFDVDANGNGTALTLAQNGTRQHATRVKG